jgi:hypothetical protein
MRLSAAALLLLGTAACVKPSGFTCTDDDTCVQGGTQGRCEPAGACSFPDTSCPSGFRFGAAEAEPLGGECVVPEADAGPLPPNLVTNPGFESDLAGWDTNNATLARIAEGHTGGFSAEVCSMGVIDYTIDDDPATVPNAPVGVTYVAAAWVRLPSGQAAQPITLTIRERNGGNEQTAETITADQTWREIRVMHTTSLTGAAVDVYVGNVEEQQGGCFHIDDVTLGQL